MNIYLFNDKDSSARFGIGTYLNELTQALQCEDVHVHIVHLHAIRPAFEIETDRQNALTFPVENWYIPEVRNQNTFNGPLYKVELYFKNVIYLLRLHIRDTKDLVFHLNYNHCVELAKGLKEVFDCKIITTVHFMKWAFELQGNLQKLHAIKSKPANQQNPFEKLLCTTDEYEGLLYKEADRVIALSHNMKNLLCSEYHIEPEKITVIPNGLFDAYKTIVKHQIMPAKLSQKAALRCKWRLSADESAILFAGHFLPVKGLVFLVRAFHTVLEKIPDCRLIIAGNGQYDAYIREAKGVCAKITFTGLLDRKELFELYQLADVGVIPSLYETFGYVAIEMMMHELPIVATATSGLNEVVDETCGLKVPVIESHDRIEIDTGLLAEKIIYMIKHPDEAMKMGSNGRKRFLKKYSLEIFQNNMLNFYNSITD